MRCYLAQGNRSLAARTFERCTHHLRKELGVEPSAATVGLYRSVHS